MVLDFGGALQYVYLSECGGSRVQYCNIALLWQQELKPASQRFPAFGNNAHYYKVLWKALQVRCYLMVWCPHKLLLRLLGKNNLRIKRPICN